MDKAAVRAQIRAKKRALTPTQIETASARLGALLAEHPLYQSAATVYGYLPFNQEVRTEPILRRALAEGKRIAVPKICAGELRFIYLDDLSRLSPGYTGIPEPVDEGPVAHDPRALVLMPGLAFDRAGRRIGYGGGFYDRFLAREPEHPTVALCYGFQLLNTLQTEEYDIPVDCVLWVQIEE